MIAPTGVGRRTAAARVGAIDDIVVNQRGTVEQFDDSRELDGTATVGVPASRIAMAKKQQSRPQPLPSPAQ